MSSTTQVLKLLALGLGWVLGCRAAAPAPPPRPVAPYDWHGDGNLRQDEGDARCRAELPACLRPFGVYVLPPSPCDGRGTLCRDFERTSLAEGRWSCQCDACLNDGDCGPGLRCDNPAPPCTRERHPNQCVPGGPRSKALAAPCPDKPLPP